MTQDSPQAQTPSHRALSQNSATALEHTHCGVCAKSLHKMILTLTHKGQRLLWLNNERVNIDPNYNCLDGTLRYVTGGKLHEKNILKSVHYINTFIKDVALNYLWSEK